MRNLVVCGRTLAALVFVASAACSNSGGTAANAGGAGGKDTTTTSDAGGGTDTGAGTDTTTATTDTAAGETAVVDILSGDSGSADTATASDTAVADTSAPDATKADGSADSAASDAKTDSAQDTKPAEPVKCKADADCPKGFGDCILGVCDVASGKCQLKIMTDGTDCKTGGICGGSGKCAQGACDAKGACGPAACTPMPLKCGDKIDLDLAKLGAGSFAVWPCAGAALGGGEAVYALSSDTTAAAVVELAEAVTGSATLLLLGGTPGGQCNPGSCSKSGAKLTVGLPKGVTQVVALDSKAGATGSVTLTVACTAPAQCGDGACGDGENCSGCPKDCGTCKECGDAKCDAATENCGSCPADCGPCVPAPPECAAKTTPGCPGCACEKCVCDDDKYCCDTAWDNQCVAECTAAKCGGKCPAAVTWCGDGKCSAGETNAKCPQDCPKASVCGDGSCAGNETCATCAGDCGFCAGGAAVSGCGNGKCDATEHCGVCPKDCGVCLTDCAPTAAKSTPGCPGCACEQEVCAKDPFCCKNAWDNLCVAACQELSGGKCPKQLCGDTVCSGTETCESCLKDCGACACGDGKCQSSESDVSCPADCLKCGDGKCSAGESAATCAQDCDYGSCKDSDCKGKSTTPNKKGCYCDDQCEGFGDCCPDKKQYCP